MVNIKKKEREGIQQTGEMRERQKWGKIREEEEKAIFVTTNLVISLNYYKRLFQVKNF